MNIDFTSLHGHILDISLLISKIKDEKLRDEINKVLVKLDSKLTEQDKELSEVIQTLDNIRGLI